MLTVVEREKDYYVVDGNHRLVALRQNKRNEKVLCSVYANLTDSEALYLGIRANYSNESFYKMTSVDCLKVTRKLWLKCEDSAEFYKNIYKYSGLDIRDEESMDKSAKEKLVKFIVIK